MWKVSMLEVGVEGIDVGGGVEGIDVGDAGWKVSMLVVWGGRYRCW